MQDTRDSNDAPDAEGKLAEVLMQLEVDRRLEEGGYSLGQADLEHGEVSASRLAAVRQALERVAYSRIFNDVAIYVILAAMAFCTGIPYLLHTEAGSWLVMVSPILFGGAYRAIGSPAIARYLIRKWGRLFPALDRGKADNREIVAEIERSGLIQRVFSLECLNDPLAGKLPGGRDLPRSLQKVIEKYSINCWWIIKHGMAPFNEYRLPIYISGWLGCASGTFTAWLVPRIAYRYEAIFKAMLEDRLLELERLAAERTA